MGSSLKKEILKNKAQTYKLSEYEHGLIKNLNTALVTSVYHRRLMAGMLGYIAKVKMNVAEAPKGSELRYEIDLNGDDHILTVSVEKQAK
jgi:hypothetical protein